MRTHWYGYTGASAALCLGLSMAGVAAGQEAQAPEANKPEVALTSSEQLAQAEAIEKRGKGLSERLMKQLTAARADKDILRANCVNRKLTEANANVRNVEQRTQALKAAAAGGDQARSSHEFTVVSVLSQKLDTLSREAAQCLGESIYEVGLSQVITTVPADLWPIDSRDIPQEPPPPPAVSVPPPLSPTR